MKNVEGNKFFERAKLKATSLIENNQRLKQLFDNSKEKLSEIDVSTVSSSKLVIRLKVFLRMVKAYAKGSYRDIETKNILLMLAALIYFVTPLDLVPDFIPITGLLDDFTVVLWVYNKLQEEIDKFIAWEEGFENA